MNASIWKRRLHQAGAHGATCYAEAAPTQTHQLLNGIIAGVDIGYQGDRSTPRRCHNLSTATDTAETRRKVSEIIAQDVKEGKTIGPFNSHKDVPFPHFSVSPIGAVVKTSGKVRKIHHLSHPHGGDSINANIPDEYQPLGSLKQAIRFIRRCGKGCWLTKLDVRSAYRQIPVRPEDWPLLDFQWEGKYYFDVTLPFGLKSSCKLWELYATALHYFLEHLLLIECTVHYIDDFLFVVRDVGAARALLDQALTLCNELGIPMAPEKIDGPTQCLTFLGIELDTIAMVARLSDERLSELRARLRAWVESRSATIKERESLAGLLNFACQVVRPGRIFTQRIFAAIKKLRSKQTKGLLARHPKQTITPGEKGDALWWLAFIKKWNGVGIILPGPIQEVELFSDACNSGFGAYWKGHWIAGAWTAEELSDANRDKRISMPYLELRALVIAAAAFGRHWQGKRIRLRCDAHATVDAINKGFARTKQTGALLRYLHYVGVQHEFEAEVVWIAGADNSIADVLSRLSACKGRAERQAKEEEFRRLAPQADEQGHPIPHLPPLEEM